MAIPPPPTPSGGVNARHNHDPQDTNPLQRSTKEKGEGEKEGRWGEEGGEWEGNGKGREKGRRQIITEKKEKRDKNKVGEGEKEQGTREGEEEEASKTAKEIDGGRGS